MSEFDVAAFVRQVTDEVWNQKMVGRLYERAAANILVHYCSQTDRYGRETLINDTIRDLAAFPDLQLNLDTLLWDHEGGSNYMVSMQQTWTGRNTGYSIYGPPTGQQVIQTRLINGRIAHGRFIELWIATDELGLIRQLGLDPLQTVAHLRDDFEREKLERGEWRSVAGEVERGGGQEGPPPLAARPTDDLTGGDLIRWSQHDIWNRRLVGAIEEYYGATYAGQWGAGRMIADREELQALVLARLAMFPDFSFHIDHLIQPPPHGARGQVAAFWTWLGTYAGCGEFGPPNNRRVRATGISHYTTEEGRIVAEVTELNEFRLLQQIMEPALLSPPPFESYSVEDEA